MKAMAKELGRLAQGYKDTKGTNTVEFMDLEEIQKHRKSTIVTYAHIVVDYCPQKKDPNRVRVSARGNLINCPFELITCTADITTSKCLWNSTISTLVARYVVSDASNVYLVTPFDDPEYMLIAANLVPQEFIEMYNLQDKIKNGYIYMRIIREIYGLLQSGKLANDLLNKRLKEEDYFGVDHTPGLLKHKWRPVWFTLVVEKFGIKYIGEEHRDHLLGILNRYYNMETTFNRGLYYGITLKWNCEKCYVNISMPNYVHKNLVKYKHEKPKRPQFCPYKPAPRKYGKEENEVTEEADSPKVGEDKKKFVQQVLGSFLYYARAVDLTIQQALNAIAEEQSNPP